MLNAYWLASVVGGEVVDLVSQTGFVAKTVLLLLLMFSVLSWAIILSKWSLLRRVRVQSGRFVRDLPLFVLQVLKVISRGPDGKRPDPPPAGEGSAKAALL